MYIFCIWPVPAELELNHCANYTGWGCILLFLSCAQSRWVLKCNQLGQNTEERLKFQKSRTTWAFRARYALTWYINSSVSNILYCRAGIWVTAECWFRSSKGANNKNTKNYNIYIYISEKGNYMCVGTRSLAFRRVSAKINAYRLRQRRR